MKKVAISQSNYIPWKGYFDLINSVDTFVLLDSVQYTKSDWRNRNRIKTPNRSQWLTIPVRTSGNFTQSIRETEVLDNKWKTKHWETIRRYYAKAKYFSEYENIYESCYLGLPVNLSEINYQLIKLICKHLNIKTTIRSDNDYDLVEGKNERILSICLQENADIYLSGPLAKAYLNKELFAKEGIEVRYMNYSGYVEYDQLYPPFTHEVSILDLLFNTGENARSFMMT